MRKEGKTAPGLVAERQVQGLLNFDSLVLKTFIQWTRFLYSSVRDSHIPTCRGKETSNLLCEFLLANHVNDNVWTFPKDSNLRNFTLSPEFHYSLAMYWYKYRQRKIITFSFEWTFLHILHSPCLSHLSPLPFPFGLSVLSSNLKIVPMSQGYCDFQKSC